MNTYTILKAARRKLDELDWVQGSFQKAMGKELHFDRETTEIYNEVTGTTITIPISKTEAVCAMGAVEVVLSHKLDLDELGVDSWARTREYQAVNELLLRAIPDSYIPRWEDLDTYSQDDITSEFEYHQERGGVTPWEDFRDDMLRSYADVTSDAVEEWNDEHGRTKEEVLALFDSAIALAGQEESLLV